MSAIALADGMVIPTVAFPAKVTIPDQQALICFTNGTERLVIETRFTGAGTNFAWVVPFPSQPVIEEATTGLFPTLEYLFRPQITHEVSRDYLAIMIGVGVIILFRFAKRHSSFLIIFILVLFLALVAAMLLPALAGAKSKAMSSVSSSQPVDILDRKLVGIFETTTIGSRDPTALENWLREKDFTVSTNAGPIIANYVKQGWVFVVAKIRRDTFKNETSTPHPLSFTFKTEQPVYPMRLTSVDDDCLKVELYVFGSTRAEAPHFKVERCTRPNYPVPPANDFWSWNWRLWSPENPDIVHPLLRKWTGGSPVATKLVATLSRAEMQQDVWLGWTAFSEKKNRLFSHSGALTTGLNWGSWLLFGGLLVLWGFRLFCETNHRKGLQLAGMLFAASLGLTCLTYLFLPKTEVRLVKVHYGEDQNKILSLYYYLLDTNSMTHAEISMAAKHILSYPTNYFDWVNWSKSQGWKNWDNHLVGGQIHEEDSPGNFTLREVGNQIEFVAYDAQGAEHIQQEKWDVHTQP